MAHPSAWDGQIPCHEFPRERIVWVEVPKAASTSLKLALANGLHGTGFVDDRLLHEHVGYTYAANVGELGDWLTWRWPAGPWWRFTVVRDPVARFVSLYREKVDRDGLGDIDAWVAAQADSHWWEDIHAVPQVRIVGDPGWYDHVGHVERLDETAALLSERLGQPIILGRHNATGKAPPIAARTRDMLRRRYADDLSAFGY